MSGLYVHVPFCERKCVYCDFYSVETEATEAGALDKIVFTDRADAQEAFVAACVREIEIRARELETNVCFDSVFFGGGTPSLLSPEQLERIAGALRRGFTVADDAEFTVECNPGTVDEEKLHAYRSIGVNRLSFGVQSFHDDDLRFLSRIHTAEQAVRSIEAAHAAEFANVNLDLMFSLPNQSPERWMSNLDKAFALGTTHLSCYSLTVEKGTPLYAMVQRGEAVTPSEDSDAALFELTMKTTAARGFRHYEVSNYALPGFECRHNLTYWRHEDYLGFGPSAHSTWQRKRWWNIANVESYARDVTAGTFPVQGMEDLDPSTLRSEHIYLRLRSEGIDVAEFQRRFRADFLHDNGPFIHDCLRRELLVREGDVIRLTRKGFLVCDEICARMG